MENTSIEELIKLKKQELRRSMEKLDADNSRLLTRIPRLKGLLERNQIVKANIEKRSQELEVKEKELQSWSLELEERCQNVEKEKAEAGNLKKLMEECTEELKSKTNQLTARLASLAKTQRDLESNSKQIRDIAMHCVETLQAEDRKREVEVETDGKKKELALILEQIKESDKQLVTVNEQLESRRKALEIVSLEIVFKERELKCLRESIKLSNSDLVRHEQQPVSAPINDTSQENATETEVDIEDALTHHETLDLLDCDDVSSVLKESLNPAEFVLELVEEQIREEVDLHDSLMANWVLLFEELAKIQRSDDPQVQHKAKQVATLWKKKIATRAPKSSLEVLAFLLFIVTYGLKILLHTEFILELVEEEIREEVDLHDSLMKTWVLLFEELERIQRSDDPQVEHKATQVATLWKRKIAIEAPKSSLEVLAFLMFLVEYGLKEVINEEETALLASSIAQYEQSPRLFISLGLKREIRECVKDLIKKSQYIPAVRLICLHKLNEEFLPSQLLLKEIDNLKQSALQGKDKDVGRLRAILELVAIYKLEIELPGDLVVKLVVQREELTPPVVQCNVKYGNSPNPASAQRSSLELRVPKFEVEPYLNPYGKIVDDPNVSQ